ncbi:unnamed protein product [Pylaiella littoralis]
MGNKASSPSRSSDRNSRGGTNASRTDRQRNSSHQAERSSTSSSSTITVNVDVDVGSEDDVYGGQSDDSDREQIQPSAGNRPQQQQQQQQQEMSWYQMAKAGYQELVNAIIRPPRAQYDVQALGPVEFEFVGKSFKRIDFRLLNDRGHVLECSHWQPHGWRRAEQLPCIVYMHGNSSARVEALPQLSLALTLGATLVAFDFAGSGKSEGEHVSLGYYERDDLKAVIEHLRKSGQVSAIALWGRSMGAATALLHGDRDPSIAALVLDSAFADLTQLAEEMVERGRQAGLTVPGIVVKMVMRMIRGTVTKTANFNVRDLCPIKHADRTFIPALFVAGLDDDFIKPHHSEQICEAYAGDKNFIKVDGDHNSARPTFLFDSVYIFLQNYLRVPSEWGLDRENTVMGFPPWHLATGGRGRGAAAAAAAAALFGAAPARDGDGGGFDADFADFDWDGIGLDDDIGVDGNPSVGMTRARQAQFQTALFHVLAQEQKERALDEADGGGSGGREPPTATAGAGADGSVAAAAAAANSPPTWMDRRSQTPTASSLGSADTLPVLASSGVTEEAPLRGGDGGGGGAKGLSGGDNASAVGQSGDDGESSLAGGVSVSREEQLLIEEEQGAEAVAAVAAALMATRITTTQATVAAAAAAAATVAAATVTDGEGKIIHSYCSPSSSFSLPPPPPPPGGFATPNASARPAMAPFSVSDTSELDDSMLSPGDGPLRRVGRGGRSSSGSGLGLVRFNSGGNDSVPEGPEGDDVEEVEEGGVEGVTEVSAALGNGGGEAEAEADESRAEAAAATATHAVSAGRQQQQQQQQALAAAEEGSGTPVSAESDGAGDVFFDAKESVLGGGEDKQATGAGKSDKSLERGGGDRAIGAGNAEDDERDSLSGDEVGWKRATGLVGPDGASSGLREAGESWVAAKADTPTVWSCSKCTLFNSAGAKVCLACTSPRAV